MELLALSAAVRSAAVAWQVGEALYHLIHNTKVVNQTVIDLHASTIHLGIVCDATARHVQYLSASPNRDDLQIFHGIEMVLKRCDEQMRRLSAAIDGVRKEHRSFIGQTVRQIKLNLSDYDIRKYKDYIESDVSKLNHFLVILIHRDLRLGLSRDIDGPNSSTRNRSMAVEENRSPVSALSPGSSSREGSIGGNTIAGDPSQSSVELKLDIKDDYKGRSDRALMKSPKGSLYAASTEHARKTSLEEIHDPVTMIAHRYLCDGGVHFEKSAFGEAQKFLRKALAEVRVLEQQHPDKFVSLAGVQYKLAVCSYHLEDAANAETALANMVGKQPTSHAENREICHAGHLLALLYARTNRVDRAASTCESIYWKQKEIFGKDHPACFESLALLSLCYRELGKTAQAELCIALVPSSEQERLRYEMSLTIFFPRRKCVGDGRIEYLPETPQCLQWSADNSCLGWQQGEYNITVYSTVSGHRCAITSPSRRIETFALSPSGDRVVFAARSTNKFLPDGHILQVYDVKSGKLIQQLKARHVRPGVTGTAFSPDGASIVVSNCMGLLEVLAVSKEAVISSKKLTLGIHDQHSAPRFSPRGHEIIVAHHAGVAIQATKSTAGARSIHLDNGSAKGGWACSPDGQYLALAMSPDKVLLAEANPSGTRRSFPLPCPPYTTMSAGEQDVAFLPNGALVVARYVKTGEDKGLTIYDVQNSLAHILDDDPGGFERLKFSIDGTYLAAVAKTSLCIRFWNVAQVVLQF